MLLRLRFQVTPRGKQTARTTLTGHGRVRTWTPAETEQLQQAIRAEAISELNRLKARDLLGRFPVIPAPNPVFLVTTYHLARPKRGVYTGLAYPTCKPDLSNMTKLLEDALTGVLWTDDRQIVENFETKRWADGHPGIDLVVADLEELEELEGRYPNVVGLVTPTSSSAPVAGSAS